MRLQRLRSVEVSIHAPARGATAERQAEGHAARVSIHAPRAGGDLHALDGAGAGPGVSIHAPARGATPSSQYRLPLRSFQSTPPRGGATFNLAMNKAIDLVSIHAPARGATAEESPALAHDLVSIHAPARGATC